MNKIDFLGIIVAENCNPNGDPANGNRPRVNFEGYGEISQECLKRKIRDRLQDAGEDIFVQASDRNTDRAKSLLERFKNFTGGIPKEDEEEWKRKVCEKWIDVRAFGQVFPFKGLSTSFNVRGPVSITRALTIDTVLIQDTMITKSVNLEESGGKDSSTIGWKYTINRGVYVFTGGIFPQLAEKTGFSDEDAEKIRQAIISMFVNDASAARPNGSLTLAELYWWRHNSKGGSYPPVRVHHSVDIQPAEQFPYYTVKMDPLPNLEPEVYSVFG